MNSSNIISLKDTKVFNPIKVGNIELSHRIALPSLTRLRASVDNIPSDLNLKYYDDRSQTPGTLVMTEGLVVSPELGTIRHVAGIFSDKQVEAWKRITDKVHENGSFIGAQLVAFGRLSEASYMKELGYDMLGVMAEHIDSQTQKYAEDAGESIRQITEEEIKEILLRDFIRASQNSFDAGFDFVEIHACSGYFLDTFLQSSSNRRTDKYGGSIENRARLILEVVDILVAKFGASKLALRISPWNYYQEMKGEFDDCHPYAQFSYLLKELQKRAESGNELAWISTVEPRVSGSEDSAVKSSVSNNFMYDIWKGKIFRSGGYGYSAPDFETVLNHVDNDRTILGFGRLFTSNPDLVDRLKNGWDLSIYDRDTFYLYVNWGYNTFNKYGEDIKFSEEQEMARTPKALV